MLVEAVSGPAHGGVASPPALLCPGKVRGEAAARCSSSSSKLNSGADRAGQGPLSLGLPGAPFRSRCLFLFQNRRRCDRTYGSLAQPQCPRQQCRRDTGSARPPTARPSGRRTRLRSRGEKGQRAPSDGLGREKGDGQRRSDRPVPTRHLGRLQGEWASANQMETQASPTAYNGSA